MHAQGQQLGASICNQSHIVYIYIHTDSLLTKSTLMIISTHTYVHCVEASTDESTKATDNDEQRQLPHRVVTVSVEKLFYVKSYIQ